jgi:hypothetical protein
MPKEKINRPKATGGSLACFVNGKPVPPLSDTVVGLDGSVVQVGWHKDSWVQVSIEADVTYLRFAADTPDAEPNTSDSQRSTVYSPPLERDELNNLIRVLRRARDQAFGRDE